MLLIVSDGGTLPVKMNGEGGANVDERLAERLESLSVVERRCDMLYRLPTMTEIKIKDLCEIYRVSRTSIVRDLDFLEEQFGMEMERLPGRYGGIFIKYGWKPPGGYYMTASEEALMKEIMEYLPLALKGRLWEFVKRHTGKNQ